MREKWRFQQDWYFTTEDVKECFEESGPKKRPKLWEEVTLPHTFRLEPYAHRGVTTAQGIGVYQKCFQLDLRLQEKKLYLTFEAVMGVTDVWLNGMLLHTKMADKTSIQETEVHTNYGGYLPFVVYLNDAVRFDGTDNLLVVKTDNRDNGQVPPGKPQELLDFTYFGGIYRSVWLEAVENIFITNPLYEDIENGGGILLEYPLVSSEKSIVSVKTQLCSAKSVKEHVSLTHEIIGKDGNCKVSWTGNVSVSPQSTQEICAELILTYPELWSLQSPNLYDLVTTVRHGEMVLDQKKTRFGIRQIEVDRSKGLLINGEVQPFLSGVNRHQDYPIIGNAAPASMQKRDAILYQKAGFHVIRAAHYPMSEEFLNACDELGLLLFEATPGWQWYPTDNAEPFSSRVRNNIRQMVRRDRNHPCVLAYETVLNETYHVPNGFSRESALAALAEQKSAKIAAESYGYNASPEENGIDREADFIYGFLQPLEKTEKAVMFLREYADCWIESYGKFESRRVTRGRTDGFYPCGEGRNLKKANQMLWRELEGEYSLARCYEIQKNNPAFVGAAIWTGIDSRGARSEMSPCGIWDGFRLPKTSYWAFASQQAQEPVLHLASEWTKTPPVLDKAEDMCQIGLETCREVYVYSNAASVVLSVERGDEVLWKMEGKPYTKDKAVLLPHPPFYFAQVPYTEGTTLRVQGYNEHFHLVGQEIQKTAKIPHHLHLRAEFLGIPMQADGSDLVLLHAEILDANDMLCTDAAHRVFFQVEGDAQIVGTGNLLSEANPARGEAGIASAYLRAGKTPGKIQIHAAAKDLGGDELEVQMIPPEYEEIPGTRYVETDYCVSKTSNLSSHKMEGEAKCLLLAEVEGEMFPESVRLWGTACWKISGETYLETGCRIQSGDPEVELLFYLDDVLRWRGKAAQAERISLLVEEASELKAELRAGCRTEILLLSPYLFKGKIVNEETELSENIAFGKPAFASVNSKDAENIWHGDIWLGGRPEEEDQEWRVDLGRTFAVRNAMIHVGGQMGSDCTFYQYEIYTSSDDEHWDKQAGQRRTSWSNGVLDYFTAQEVRYVKVVFRKVDGRLCAGIQKFEIYSDYGVDSVGEYALSGIAVEGNDIVFSPDCLNYTLPVQEQLTVRALAYDSHARVTVCGTIVPHPLDNRITSVQPITVKCGDCKGNIVIEVCAASGKGVRRYNIFF